MGLRYIVALCSVFVILSLVSCQSVNNDTDDFRTALQKGMKPLFDMTNNFLSVIQPRSKGSVLQKAIEEPDYKLTKIDTEKVSYFAGYLILILVGILFFIILPLTGLFFCCCRLCGNCGGGAPPYKHKHHNGCEKCLGVTVFLLASLVLAATVCLFLTNELARQQTEQEEGLMVDLYKNVEHLDTYVNSTLEDLESATVGNLNQQLQVVERRLDNVAMEAQTDISSAVNATASLDAAYDLARKTSRVEIHLMALTSYRSQLMSVSQSVTNKINTVKAEIDGSLGSLATCTGTCNALRTKVQGLSVTVDYSQLPTVASQLAELQQTNLTAAISEGEAELEKVSTVVGANTQSTVDSLKAEIDKLTVTVTDGMHKVVTDVAEKVKLDSLKNKLNDNKDDVEKYGGYVYYVGIALASILLLIVLLVYMGLLFGCCGRRPTDDAGGCHKGHGANLLMAGVGFQFIFSWLLMLVVIILFVIGGVTYTEVCRHMVGLEASPVVKDIDRYAHDHYYPNLSFYLTNVLSDCDDNQALYQVLQLDTLLGLQGDLDINVYDFNTTFDAMKQIQIVLPLTDIYTDSLKNDLDQLKNAGVGNIDIAAFTAVLEQALLNEDLNSLAQELNNFADTVTETNIQTELRNQATDLQGINNQEVGNLTATKNSMTAELTQLETEIAASPTYDELVVQVQTDLKSAEQTLNSQASQQFLTFISLFADVLLLDTAQLLSSILHDIMFNVGRCHPLYQVLETTVVYICEDTLNPINAYWFCLGWAVFFFIPLIIVSVKLAGFYRKTESYRYRTDKDFDDPDFERYTGTTNSNIPLQQYDRQAQQYRYTDEYTTSRSMNIRPQPLNPDHTYKDYSGGGAGEGYTNPPPYYNETSNTRFAY